MRNAGWRMPVVTLLSMALTLLPVIAPLAAEEQLSLPKQDLTAPEILHVPISEPLQPGESHTFSATVTDNVKVKSVDMFYRVVGESEYKRLKMSKNGENSDEYRITLDSDIMEEPGIEYYIQAVDVSGNSLLHGYSFSPLTIAVGAQPINKTDAEIISAKPEETSYKWLWITLGVLAVGAVASGGGGGGGDDGGNGKPGAGGSSLIVTAPAPE